MVEISNAGNPHPLLVRNGKVTAIESSGLPVGMFCSTESTVMELRLERGDSIIIYSDGVSEAMDDLGEEYGVERLRQLIADTRAKTPSELIAACRNDLASFRGRSRADDVTLFALTRG